MNQQTVKLNYLRIAPRKVRRLAILLKGLPVSEAEAQLMLSPHRGAKPLLKLLRSAVAAAKSNRRLDESRLWVKEVRVDQGPMLKRILPRARGIATPIQKKMSHVTLTLVESPSPVSRRFTILPPPKKSKLPREGKSAPAKKTVPPPAAVKKEKETAGKQPGFFRRIFRRKAV